MRTYGFLSVLWCLLLTGVEVNAQESFHPKGVYVRLGAAYTPVIGTPKLSSLVDPLISLPAHNVSVVYEVQWQINRRLGVLFQYNYVNISTDIRGDFARVLQQQFPDDYAAIHFNGLLPEEQNGLGPSQALFGCSYTFDAGKWSLQPRILLGSTTFNPLTATVALKRRDSNQLGVLVLKPDTPADDSFVSAFTPGLGALIQRHLWRRWSFFGTVQGTAFKPNLGYSYSLVNQVNGTEIVQTFGSGQIKLAYMLHMGAGLTFRITRRR